MEVSKKVVDALAANVALTLQQLAILTFRVARLEGASREEALDRAMAVIDAWDGEVMRSKTTDVVIQRIAGILHDLP